jgi:hypothetical protein
MALSVTGCASSIPAPTSALCRELVVVTLTASEWAAIGDKTADLILSNNQIIDKVCGE